jgi:hypothetical protein
MLFIGQRCSHDACNLVDFLPLKVSSSAFAAVSPFDLYYRPRIANTNR